ncbi:MAG: sulfotransferase family 2 domain-containing protein [Gammaproteobacteria bacterium]|nr:sulfotransferase family 2 domain-containing protein [Gammaproteobacteria bacterium]
MIISPSHKFVYIGIPRTASKSMNEWLMRHYGGIWYGGHHDYHGIPEDARSFLVFTTVRNPYDRAVSGFFRTTVG